tara:strand:+ start:9572 stop:13588 length:4017 start_codon:yes stop_codon:yes gene_type:complete
MTTISTILDIKVVGTDSMAKLKTEIDKTNAELKELKESGKQAGESQDKYNAKIVTAETKLKGLRGELNKGKTELIKNAKAVSATDKSYNSLTAQNAKLSASLRKLADPLGKNKVEFQKLSSQIKINTTSLKAMDAQMGRNQRNVGNYKQAITSVATAVGGAIIAFKTFQRVLGTFVDFEFQMKQVGVISGATAEDLELLSNSAKELGASTAFTAGEVAGLQKELAKLGFDPTEIEAMTGATLDLAFAFGNDIAETGEIVGVVLNSYKLEASEATRVTDILASAFSSTALDLQKFNVAFPKVGAIASQLGFSLEGTTALLGQLSNAGLEASTAGTSLRSIFLKLADSNSSLSQKLGGSVTSIDTLLPALNDLFESGTDVEEMLGLTDKRSVTAFATLASGAKEVGILTKSLEESEGTAKRFADVMRDSLKGSLDEASSSANGFVIELFEALAPAITLIVDGIALLFNGLSTLVENFKLISIAVGAYTAVIIAGSVAQGTFTASLLKSGFVTKAWNVIVKVAKAFQTAWNFAMSANPVGLLISGIATGIAILASWNSETEKGADIQKESNVEVKKTIGLESKLSDIRKKNGKQQTDEIARLKALSGQIKNANLDLKEREKALSDFNKLAGTNISNLQDEKTIVAQLETSYKNAVDAIKRKIVLQASEESITELIKAQVIAEKELNKAKEDAIAPNKTLLKINNDILKLDEERQSVGARSTADFVADSDERSNAIKTEDEVLRDFYLNEAQQVNTRGNNISANTRIIIQGLDDEATAVEENQTATEQANLSLLNSESAVISIIKDKNDAQDVANDVNNNVLASSNKLENINNQIAKVYADQNSVLAGLSRSTNTHSFATGNLKTAYQLLKDEVKGYEEELTKQIVIGEQAKTAFINSEEAQKMSVEERATRVGEIETQTAIKVTKATNDVIKSKKDLKIVDDEIEKQNKIVNKGVEEQTNKLLELREAGLKVIDADKEQLRILTDLENAGADVAKERISLALKVAKAQLDLALKTAEASGISTDAQIADIKRLKGEIEGFEVALKNDGGSGGFLKGAIFGTNEDGGILTGEELIGAIDMTLSLVTDVMSSFNALQQEQLNTKLGVIEQEKATEIEAYKETAEFASMSSEEQADAIEGITKKHDDKMLALKIEQFDKDKKLQTAQAIIGGAQAVMNILAGTATGNVIADAIIKGVMIAGVVATTAFQLATIKAQAPPTAELGGVMDDSFFKMGGMVYGQSHAQGGEKFSVGGRVAELEGGEAVINKRSTAMFKPILSKMNVAGGGRKFADGGMVFGTDTLTGENDMFEALTEAMSNQQVLLVEADVTNSQNNVKNIESRITF